MRTPILWGLAFGALQVCTPLGFRWLEPATVLALSIVLIAAFAAHGAKDFWQERHHFVANTRWWPSFCATVDWLVAAVLIVEIAAGVDFH